MIVLQIPDHDVVRLDDLDAHMLAELLWDRALGGGTAAVAASIQHGLRRDTYMHSPIGVSRRAAAAVMDAVERLH